MNPIFLIFPNQLFNLKNISIRIKNVALIEDSLFFGCDYEWKQKFHSQKIIFRKETIRAYKESLMEAGYKVTYIKHKRNTRTEDNLNYLTTKGFNNFITYEAFDWSLEKRIKEFCFINNYNLEIIRSKMFLTDHKLIEETIKEEKIFGMQKFYKKQRKHLNILIEEDGSPTGGEWSFDKMNRKKLPSTIKVPTTPILKTNKFLEKAKKEISINYQDYYGNHENSNYPVTHHYAEE